MFPDEIADVFEELKTEVTWLHGRWIIYRQLYAESERRIDLLNESASTFFFILQDVLIGEIQVSLSKLTDPPRSGSHENLSLELLQQRLESTSNTELALSTRQTLNALQHNCEPFRQWRNKKLAHLDLLTAMEASPNPLPGTSRQMIEDSLELVREYLNSIERSYCASETGYEHFIMQSDGDHLVALLRNGLRYEELVQDEVIPYDDFKNGAWRDA